jgi:hypothetical protein
LQINYTKEEFIDLWNEKGMTKAKMCKLVGISRYKLEQYLTACNLDSFKPAGRPPAIYIFAEEG